MLKYKYNKLNWMVKTMITSTNSKFIWIPRVLTIFFILFISIFALDVFEGDASVIEKIGGLLIHLIPSFVLVAVLIVFWKRPLVSGILFILAGILFTIYYRTYDDIFTFITITVMIAICGILYIISHAIMKKKR